MTERKFSPLYHGAIIACGLLVVSFVVFWIVTVVHEVRVIRARQELFGEVERGDAKRVLALIDEIDPTGNGTAEEWTGEPGSKGQSGFSWLLQQWRDHTHNEGAPAIFERLAAVDPAFPREELITHLEWLTAQNDQESLEELFGFALHIDFDSVFSKNAGEQHPLFAFAGRDPRLALLAWEAMMSGRLSADLPDDIIKKAFSASNLALAEPLDRLLRITGILDPVESFIVRDALPERSWNSGTTWIERIYGQIANPGIPELETARELITLEYLGKVSPETPGLFLLHRFLEDSTESHREFSLASIETALPVFERLQPEGKASVAKLLDRNLPDYGEHETLKNWVWAHYRPEWEAQRDRYLDLSEAKIEETWRSRALQEWLRSGAKHDRAADCAAVVKQLHKLHVAEIGEMNFFYRNDSREHHPFVLATIRSIWTKEGTPPLPEQFALILAFHRDPSFPPNHWFPSLLQMGYRKADGSFQRSPWYKASAEEFNEAVTRLGEPFADDPLRFLIVPFFHELADNFSETLQKPAELAKFQMLASANDRPGGWLAKDLADLLPRWWCETKAMHEALLAEGGHSYSYERMDAYLEDRSTPVAARVSYALGVLDWHISPFSSDRGNRISASLPYFPEMDELALEFANEFKGGNWSLETIPRGIWDQVLRSWLYEPLSPDDSNAAANRKSARQALLSRLEPFVLQSFASAPEAKPGLGETPLDPIIPLIKTYATLLRLEENDEALTRLWTQAERCLKRPHDIFEGLPNRTTGRTEVLANAAADTILRRFREGGWPAVAEHVKTMDGPVAYAALSEATAKLNLKEWIEFCTQTLDLSNAEGGPASEGRERFHALPPAEFIKAARNEPEELRPQFLLSELAGANIPPKHAGFFSLALPPVFRHVVGRGQSATVLFRALEAEEERPIDPAILREIACACNSKRDSFDKRHLEALHDPSVPLAQRWIGANYFQIVRTEGNWPFYPRVEEWRDEERSLAETGVDLLVEAIDHKLPVWLLADRGLGLLDFRPTDPNLTVADFSTLHRQDKDGQKARAEALLTRERIEAMLDGHPQRNLFLSLLYSMALAMDDRPLAADLFIESEPGISFEEELTWLFLGKFHGPIGQLFARDWHRIGELSLGFYSSAFDEELETILGALPDDPDLRILVQATLSQRGMSTGLVNPSSNRVNSSTGPIISEFLLRNFESPEMEALCLARLPVRMEQSSALGLWVENRLKGKDWKTMLAERSNSIRGTWPYWSRRIERLAGAGEFETLSDMLPEASWFDIRRPRPFDDGYSGPGVNTVEEMVWMAFARPVAHQLRYGSTENRLDAAAIAARLLIAPPRSKGRDEYAPTFPRPKYKASTFHSEAVQELWLHATVATLIATLEEPREVASARCNKLDLPNIRTVTHDSLIRGSSHQSFFRLLAEQAETLTELRRKELFLRAFDCKPFFRTTGTRILPCHSLAKIQLPSQISLDYMVKLAEARLDAEPNQTFRLADLGLTQRLAGNPAVALPLLEQVSTRLDADLGDDSYLLNEVSQAISRIRSQPPSANITTAPGTPAP